MMKVTTLFLFTLLFTVACGGGGSGPEISSGSGGEDSGSGAGGSGSGSSDGSGSGSSGGSGSGSTDGSGSGSTDGSGSGSTDGSGSGSTDGSGSGSTDGTGSGSTDGTGSGSTDGTGSGSTDGTGSGISTGPSCNASGEIGSDADYSVLYPYCVKSGRVTYSVTSTITSNTVDGTMVMETTGEDIISFTDWGHIRKNESTSHTEAEVTIGGKVTNMSFDNHSTTKIIDKSLYSVNFEREEISKTDFTDFVPALNIISNYILDDGEGIVYENDGFDIVNHQECDQKKVVLSALNSTATTCDYKGVELKTVLDAVQTKSDGTAHMVVTKQATKIEFDRLFTTDELALPDFPVINGAQLQYDNPSAVSVLYPINIRAIPVSCSDGSGSLIVKNDVINGSVSLDDNDQVFEVSGEIGLDKKIYGGFVRGNTRVADYEGVATDTGLSGTWQDFGGCYGTWESY